MRSPRSPRARASTATGARRCCEVRSDRGARADAGANARVDAGANTRAHAAGARARTHDAARAARCSALERRVTQSGLGPLLARVPEILRGTAAYHVPVPAHVVAKLDANELPYPLPAE